VDILVPAPNGALQFTTGTSVATANVSGVAALLIARKPSLTPEEIRAILVRTAKHLGPRGINPQFGAGLVDPLKALELLTSYMPEQDGVRRFLASPDASNKYVEDGFSALGYARDDRLVTKTTRPPAAPSRDWLAWIDVRGGDYNHNTFGSDLKGTQVNALAGLTRKFTPNFLVGVLGGYERFDYSSQAFNGVLKGDGWTAGTYLGWRLTPNVRFDAGGARSAVLVNDTAGIAAGNFIGHRWLVTGGFAGTYGWRAVLLEPSARVFALWEHENAYTDSLGTLQTERNFATGRASGGVKASYPLAWSSTTNVAPYLGHHRAAPARMVRARNGRRGHDLRSRRAQRWRRIRWYRQRLPHLDLAGARDRGVLKEQSLSRCAGPIPGLARPYRLGCLISAFGTKRRTAAANQF